MLHGLSRTARSMRKLERTLQQDYHVVNQSYPANRHSIEALAEMAIAPALEECGGVRKIHFVTHSLGGILVRQYLSRHGIKNIGRTLMLGPPNQGSELSDFFAGNRVYQFLNGPTGLQLGTGRLSVPIGLGKFEHELGIIAGRKNTNPLFAKLIPGENDGKVSVERSKLDGMTDHLVLPVTHTFMMRNDSVINQVRYYLQHGQFERADSAQPESP